MVYYKKEAKLSILWLIVGLLAFTLIIPASVVGGKIPKPKDFPSRSIEYVVPWGAGGGSDTFGRVINIKARREMGVAVVVINLPGGGRSCWNPVCDETTGRWLHFVRHYQRPGRELSARSIQVYAS